MNKLVVICLGLIVGVTVSALAQWYDPNNPNPTQHDVWEAERSAQNHMQKSAEAMSSPDTWASIREQEKANQARQDADQMRMRMWENERRENARREEENNRIWREQQQRQNEFQQWNNNNGGFVPGNAPAVPVVVNQAPRIRGRALNNEAVKMMGYVRNNRRAIDVELRDLGVVKWQYLIKFSAKAPLLDAWFEFKGYGGGGAFRLKEYKNLYSDEDLLSPVDLVKKLMAK